MGKGTPTLIFSPILQRCNVTHNDHHQTVNTAAANASNSAQYEELLCCLRKTTPKVSQS
jgi:hypothetical protein